MIDADLRMQEMLTTPLLSFSPLTDPALAVQS